MQLAIFLQIPLCALFDRSTDTILLRNLVKIAVVMQWSHDSDQLNYVIQGLLALVGNNDRFLMHQSHNDTLYALGCADGGEEGGG